MNRYRMAWVAIGATLLIAAMAIGVASAIPADAMLPTHWGVTGEPDRFSDKWTALLVPALVAGGVSLLFYFLPALEPRRKGFERSQGLYLWGWAALLVMSLCIELAVVSAALGWPVRRSGFLLLGLGIMFVMIGNQLGKSRSMYMIGFRTPWTLASEEVWVKTHRLGGKLMVGGGALLAIAAFLPLPGEAISALLIGVILLCAGWPFVYSYWLWRREQRGQASS